jgi:hypothetical protein
LKLSGPATLRRSKQRIDSAANLVAASLRGLSRAGIFILGLVLQEDGAIAKRELIEPKSGDKRYARRDERGHFTNEQDDVGKTLTQDRRKHVKHEAPHGEGDCDAGSQ